MGNIIRGNMDILKSLQELGGYWKYEGGKYLIKLTSGKVTKKKKLVVVAKKTKKKTLDDFSSIIQSEYTDAMISIEVCKTIVKELNIDDYDMIDLSIPKMDVREGDNSFLIFFNSKANGITINFSGPHVMDILFLVPMDDNYIERIRTIMEAMRFTIKDDDWDDYD